jgi:hypothetical protein
MIRRHWVVRCRSEVFRNNNTLTAPDRSYYGVRKGISVIAAEKRRRGKMLILPTLLLSSALAPVAPVTVWAGLVCYDLCQLVYWIIGWYTALMHRIGRIVWHGTRRVVSLNAWIGHHGLALACWTVWRLWRLASSVVLGRSTMRHGVTFSIRITRRSWRLAYCTVGSLYRLVWWSLGWMWYRLRRWQGMVAWILWSTMVG